MVIFFVLEFFLLNWLNQKYSKIIYQFLNGLIRTQKRILVVKKLKICLENNNILSTINKISENISKIRKKNN